MAKTFVFSSIDDIRKYSDDVCRVTAGLIRDELTKTAQLAIAEFYGHYHPKYYNRHYDNFQKNSFTKYYAHYNKYYYGGVRLTPEEMDDIYGEKHPVQEVFDTVYAGFHGPQSAIDFGYGGAFPEVNVPRMWPSPRQLILDKREDIFEHRQKYVNDAVKKLS